MPCIPDCTTCCEPVDFSPEEWEKVKDRPMQTSRVDKCDFLINNQCSIYSDRPLVCRIFGATKGLEEEGDNRCPHGIKSAPQLSMRGTRRLFLKYLTSGGIRVIKTLNGKIFETFMTENKEVLAFLDKVYSKKFPNWVDRDAYKEQHRHATREVQAEMLRRDIFEYIGASDDDKERINDIVKALMKGKK